MARIYSTETWSEIAQKIWKSFDVGDSCQVVGTVRDVIAGDAWPKGELVVKELERLDLSENVRMHLGSKKKQRKYVFRSGSVGGPIAHKIFTWEKRIVDSEIRYTIWRFQ